MSKTALHICAESGILPRSAIAIENCDFQWLTPCVRTSLYESKLVPQLANAIEKRGFQWLLRLALALHK